MIVEPEGPVSGLNLEDPTIIYRLLADKGFKRPKDTKRFPRWIRACVRLGHITQKQADILVKS